MEKTIDVIELLKAVWKKRKMIYKWVAIGLALGLIVAFSIPKTYTSTVKITPDSKTSKSQVSSYASMLGLATDDNEGLGKEIYPVIINSTPFLLEFAHIDVKYRDEQIELYQYLDKFQKSPWWSYVINAPMKAISWIGSSGSEKKDIDFNESIAKQDAFVNKFLKLINYTVDKKTNIITIGVTMQDPAISAQIADSVISKFKLYLNKIATNKISNTLANNIVMQQKAKERFFQLDSAYAATADQNQNLISKSAQIKLERLQNERNLAYQIYSQISMQVEDNMIKLEEQRPVAIVIEPARIPINAASPNKLMILISFVVLSVLIASAKIIYKEIAKPV